MTSTGLYQYSRPLSVLLLEDYELDAELIRMRLQKTHPEWVVDHVSNQSSFEAYLKDNCPDVILSDYNIPQFSGLEAFLRMKELGLELPFILITGQIPEEAAVELIEQGVDDYIIKSSLLRLDVAIQQAIDKHTQEKQKRTIQRQLAASEERYRSIFHHAGVALVEFTTQGEIRKLLGGKLESNELREVLRRCVSTLKVAEANHEAIKLFEAEDAPSFTSSFNEIFSIPFLRYILNSFGSFNEGNRAAEDTIKVRTFKGHRRYFKVKTVYDPSRSNSFTVSFFDMTETKDAEERAMRITERLEDTVAQRMLELSELNEKLRSEAEEREKINEVMRENYIAMTESIIAAKRIQQLLLPSHSTIARGFDDAFVYSRPKDIVSGDFYWFHEEGDTRWLACVDCTGHGVPGAFMSMISSKLLSQAIVEESLRDPDEVLSFIDQRIVKELKQHDAETLISTGMDIALCRFDMSDNVACFAGAYQNLYHKQGSAVQLLRGNRCSLGGTFRGQDKNFTLHRVPFNEGDQFYMLSDGFTDQFGGPKNKKFSRRRWIRLLHDISEASMYEQEMTIKRTLQNWKGTNEQIDDILVMGIKV